MRTLATIILTAGLALPAAAAENPCTTVNILHTSEGIFGELVEHQEGAPRVAVVGEFVWFTWAEDSDFGANETLSFDIMGVATAIGCADGSVDLIQPVVDSPAEVPANPAPTPEPLRPICETYADSLEYVCTLPNLTLRIS